MPRYAPLEDLYAASYLCENDAGLQNSVLQQTANAPQGQQAGPNLQEPPQETEKDDYQLRRSILKMQEWVMFIDHNFPDVVDEIGGMAAFLSEMVADMEEDEMIRPSQNQEQFDEEEPIEDEMGEDELTDQDIADEVATDDQQAGAQSFQNVNNKNK